MDDLEEVTTCPLGSTCVEVKDNKIHRCAWHTKIKGTDNNTGEEVDRWDCAMSWLPPLLIENSNQQRATGAAVESFRNETVKATQATQQLLFNAKQTIGGNSETIIDVRGR